jgi:hypothetical protein
MTAGVMPVQSANFAALAMVGPGCGTFQRVKILSRTPNWRRPPIPSSTPMPH